MLMLIQSLTTGRYIADIECPGLMIFILPINFGYEASSTGNLLAIPAFLQRFGTPLPGGQIEVSAYDQQVLNAGFTCGVFTAAFTVGFVSDIIGRKWTILVASTVCIAGIFVQGFSTSFMMLFAGKFISSFGFGLGHTLAPVYVAEIAPDSIRGVCLVLVVSKFLTPCPENTNPENRTP